jgi:hypothetical protein
MLYITGLTKRIFVIVVFILCRADMAHSTPPKKDIYQIRIYRLKTNEQLQQVDSFLKTAWLPAVHRAGIGKVGVFQPLANDTAGVKSVYVFIPFASMDALIRLDKKLAGDAVYTAAAKSFTAAAFDHPPYERMESVLLEAFNGQKHFVLPAKTKGTVFELRSYESPTENLHDKKVAMFENGEIKLFSKLGFHTVFYANVISGNRMPNFMYMPSFESLDEKNAHWKTFGNDPQWKEMSALPVNENKVSVSRIESILMKATDYSDF